jgi:hypothetical protein
LHPNKDHVPQSLSKTFTMFKEKIKNNQSISYFGCTIIFANTINTQVPKQTKTCRFKNIWTLRGAKKHIYKI